MALLAANTERAEVVRRLDEAERASFETVFAREHATMVRLAYLLVGSQAIAEEAVQDAFARLLDRYERVANPGGYVRTATINRCRDLLRRSRLEYRTMSQIRPRPPVEPESDDLIDSLARIDRPRREVLVLRFYLGHTTAEIAELLKVPEGTVRSRMQRGLEDLREVLT